MTNHLKYFFGILLLLVLFSSCQHSEQPKSLVTTTPVEVPTLVLTDLGIKKFSLAPLVDFEGLYETQINKINDKEYFSFFDVQTNAFHIHDYKSGQLIQSTTLVKEGPNTVHFFLSPSYHLHSLDSIFINTSYYGYFLVDDTGNVLSKISDGEGFNINRNVQIKFNEFSHFEKGSIYGSITGNHQKKAEHLPFLEGELNFKSGKLTTAGTHSRSLYQDYEALLSFFQKAKKENKLYVNIHRHTAQHGQNLYATTVIADTVRVFNNEKLVKSIYAGLPDIKMPDYQTYLKNNAINRGKNSFSKVQVLNQPPAYLSTIIDPNGRYLYRVISHGTKPGISPYNGEEMAVIAGASLLAIDLKTDKRYTQILPVKELILDNFSFSKPFVSTEGIHFRVQDQENEDEVQFRVFGVR